MSFNFISNFLFNIQIYLGILMVFCQIAMFSLIFLMRKSKLPYKDYILLGFLTFMILSPKFSESLVCKDIFNKEKNECSIGVIKNNKENYLVISFYDNFKNEYNGYNVLDKKSGYFKNKDTFQIKIDYNNINIQVFKSDILDELFYKKDKISKMRDDYFKSKKKDSL